jgi:hypothetical protein
LERETKKHKPETKVMKIFLGGYFLVRFISRQVLWVCKIFVATMLKKKDEEGEGEEEHEKDLENKTFKRYDIEMQFNQDNPDTWTLQSDDSTSFRPWSDDEDDAFFLMDWASEKQKKMVSVRNQVEDCELLSFSHFIERQRCKLCSFVATNFPFRFLSYILLQKIPVKPDSWFTFYCRRYLLVQIPDSHSVAEDTMPELRIRGFPLAFDRELASTKSQSNRSRRWAFF